MEEGLRKKQSSIHFLKILFAFIYFKFYKVEKYWSVILHPLQILSNSYDVTLNDP